MPFSALSENGACIYCKLSLLTFPLLSPLFYSYLFAINHFLCSDYLLFPRFEGKGCFPRVYLPHYAGY